MRRSGKRTPGHFWEEIGNAWTMYQTLFLIIGIVLFFLGLFGWGYVLAERNGTCSRLLKAEIIVQLLMLAGSIVRIGFFDYEENIGFHIRATLAVDTLDFVVAFLIAESTPVSGKRGKRRFFLLYYGFFCTTCHGADPGLPALTDPGGSDVDSGENFRTAEMR